MKKLTFFILILLSFFSCSNKSNKNVHEEVLTRHESGNKKEVLYYIIKDDGSKDYVRETLYYDEGMKHLDGPIADGKRNGAFETYYKSGALMSKGTFVNGVREGDAFTYYENGNVKYQGVYVNGKECGIWKFYKENGDLIKEVNKDLR